MNKVVFDKAVRGHFVVLSLVKVEQRPPSDCSVKLFQLNMRPYLEFIPKEVNQSILPNGFRS